MHQFFLSSPLGPKVPAVFSRQRLAVLAGAVLVNIASGTNYGFSGWAPQLGSKLRLSHTQLNVIALSGNVGVFSTSPTLGRIADSRGPIILFAMAFFLMLLGYSGIHFIFDAGLPEGVDDPPLSYILILVLCSFMTGAGGSAGSTGALNAVSRTFPNSMVGTMTGIVFSGFGLSAFIFSQIARSLFEGAPSPYLTLLAWGTSIPMLLGLLVVRPIALPASEIDEERKDGNDELGGYSPLSDGSSEDASDNRRFSMTLEKSSPPDIFGKALWSNMNFWLLFSSLTIFSGIGIMYINNVGSMVQVLVMGGDGDHDPDASSEWQAMQVSTISVTNFAGRIILGLLSDTAKRTKLPRSLCLLLISVAFFASLITTVTVDSIEQLWRASVPLGLGYGGNYVLIASLSMDHFGLKHFSENWGYLSLSPLIGGNIFSLIFGRVLDAHEPQNAVIARSGLPAHTGCTAGRSCYIDAIYIIMGAWVFGTALNVRICWRDWRRQ